MIEIVALIAASWSGTHALEIVDRATGRGVPLVEVCSTSQMCRWSDSRGMVAIDEPEWMGREVFLYIRSDGYRHAKNFFGEPGLKVSLRDGGRTRVLLDRENLAERLYRMTGEGIYRDSQMLGMKPPVRHAGWNQEVAGLDTVMHTVFQGKLFWLFGDTDKMSDSLGNLATTCARSLLPGQGGLDPEVGVDLEYFAQGGFVKPMAAIDGGGMKWMFSLMNVRGKEGVERLLARYDRMKSLGEAYDTGIAEYHTGRQQFEKVKSFGPKPRLAPYGRATRVRRDGKEYFYFSAPYATPVVRVEATAEAIVDEEAYEAYECSSALCSWKRGGVPNEGDFVDVESGKKIDAKVMSVNWNVFRKRYVAILQKNVGEVWYAEAPEPEGPWGYAQRILSHAGYTFYWPGQVAELDRREGKRIYILGTYTNAFSPTQKKTPRYDYNQLMYALNLDDERLCLPEPVYREGVVTHYEIRKAGCRALGQKFADPDAR